MVSSSVNTSDIVKKLVLKDYDVGDTLGTGKLN